MKDQTAAFASWRKTALLALLCLSLAACASGGESAGSKDPLSTAAQENRDRQGHYKIGKPYQIGGVWYYPEESYSYDETGISSWYGAEFEGRARTANGEIFNKDELTAAHKTLQLPSLARVTNLENGKSIVVRVNDRGPFAGNRLIDVSQRSAQLLGFERQGTAKVRVQVLADESRAIADALRYYDSDAPRVAAPVAPVSPVAVASVSREPLAPAPAPQPAPREAAKPVYVKPSLQNVQPVQEVYQVPVTGKNQIYIQAGAFGSLENAKKMQQSLSGLGSTRISEAVVNGAKFYRVRLGPVKDVPAADALLKKVQQSGASGARTIVD